MKTTLDPENRHPVEIAISRVDIEGKMEANTFHAGPTLARIKIYDDDTGKYCWFVISAKMTKNHRPQIEVQPVVEFKEEARYRKNVTGKWREPRERD